MSMRKVEGCAMNTRARTSPMRAWFKRWRREFNVYGLPRLAPMQLASLSASKWEARADAMLTEFRAWDALRTHIQKLSKNDPEGLRLLDAYFVASLELRHLEDEARMLTEAELDYLRSVSRPGGENKK